MTLSEIESILGELAARHKNLNAALLDTLLLSAGWEEKNIKEAQLLFKQGAYTMPVQVTATPHSDVAVPAVDAPEPDAPLSHEELTFYQSDGTEEKELHAIVEQIDVPNRNPLPEHIPHLVTEAPPEVEPVKEPTPPVVEQPAEQPIKQPREKEVIPSVILPESESTIQKQYKEIVELTGERIESPAPQERSFVVQKNTPTSPSVLQNSAITLQKEPESLIREVEPASQKRGPTIKDAPIPEDLPLLPFESSPHVWSFSRYKNTFHKEAPTASVVAQVPHAPAMFIPETPAKTPPTSDSEEEILLEKTPLTKGDESLIFLAGMMLLVIIIILGYMYSNGRL